MAVTTSPQIGAPGGPESFYEEEAGAKNADGTDGVNTAYYRSAYRHGRVVYVIKIDTAAAKDEASVRAGRTPHHDRNRDDDGDRGPAHRTRRLRTSVPGQDTTPRSRHWRLDVLALTTAGRLGVGVCVELRGIEPLTPSMPWKCSTN